MELLGGNDKFVDAVLARIIARLTLLRTWFLVCD